MSNNCLSKLLKHLYAYCKTILVWAWSHKGKLSALIPPRPKKPQIDAMIKMVSQIQPQARPAGIESAHRHHAPYHNTSYFNSDSSKLWSRKPDSVFFFLLSSQRKTIIWLFREKILCFQNNYVF